MLLPALRKPLSEGGKVVSWGSHSSGGHGLVSSYKWKPCFFLLENTCALVVGTHVCPHGVPLCTKQPTQLCRVAQLYALLMSEKLMGTSLNRALREGPGKERGTHIGLGSSMATVVQISGISVSGSVSLRSLSPDFAEERRSLELPPSPRRRTERGQWCFLGPRGSDSVQQLPLPNSARASWPGPSINQGPNLHPGYVP